MNKLDAKIKNNKKLKFGIIGLGRMGLMHAAVFNSLKNSKVIAVADPSNFPSKMLGEINPNFKVYNEALEMIDKEDINGVLIASPVASHVETAILCAEKGIPFLVEKPLALNCAQALPLLKILDKQKIPNMIGYVYRFHNSFSKGKEILDTGCLGNIYRVNSKILISQLFKKGKGWRYDPQMSGGGSLATLGSHVIDLLIWYFGNIKSVTGQANSFYSTGIDDFSHLIMKHAGDIVSILDCSWSVRFKRKMDVKIEIIGENGTLVVSEDTLFLFLDKEHGIYHEGQQIFNANDLYTPVPIDIGTPKFTRQSSYFINAIKNGFNPSPDVFQGFHVQQVVDAGYKSSNNHSETIHLEQVERN